MIHVQPVRDFSQITQGGKLKDTRQKVFARHVVNQHGEQVIQQGVAPDLFVETSHRQVVAEGKGQRPFFDEVGQQTNGGNGDGEDSQLQARTGNLEARDVRAEGKGVEMRKRQNVHRLLRVAQ